LLVTSSLLPNASRPATMRCGFHPPAVRREAPHNQRIQHTSPVTNKFAPGLAADPQRIKPINYDEK